MGRNKIEGRGGGGGYARTYLRYIIHLYVRTLVRKYLSGTRQAGQEKAGRQVGRYVRAYVPVAKNGTGTCSRYV